MPWKINALKSENKATNAHTSQTRAIQKPPKNVKGNLRPKKNTTVKRALPDVNKQCPHCVHTINRKQDKNELNKHTSDAEIGMVTMKTGGDASEGLAGMVLHCQKISSPESRFANVLCWIVKIDNIVCFQNQCMNCLSPSNNDKAPCPHCKPIPEVTS